MPSCVFRKCTTYTGTNVKSRKDVSFHLFPKDGLVKEKWVQIVKLQRREDDWMPTTYSAICSQHFVESDKYETKKNVRKLIKTAVPVIKIDSGPSCPKIIKTESLDAPTTSSTGAVSTLKFEESDSDEDPLKIPRCASPSGLSDIGSSDLEGALDTPTVLYLKKKLRENEKKLREKDEKLKEKEKKLRDKDEILRDKDEKLRDKDEKLREKNEKLKNKDEILREKEEKLREKDEKLREKDEKLRKKDEEFQKTLEEKDEKIEWLQKANKRLNEKIITLKQLLVKMKRKMMKCKETDDSDN